MQLQQLKRAESGSHGYADRRKINQPNEQGQKQLFVQRTVPMLSKTLEKYARQVNSTKHVVKRTNYLHGCWRWPRNRKVSMTWAKEAPPTSLMCNGTSTSRLLITVVNQEALWSRAMNLTLSNFCGARTLQGILQEIIMTSAQTCKTRRIQSPRWSSKDHPDLAFRIRDDPSSPYYLRSIFFPNATMVVFCVSDTMRVCCLPRYDEWQHRQTTPGG